MAITEQSLSAYPQEFIAIVMDKYEKMDGICASIFNDGYFLVLKRRKSPFITNPGKWAFVTGKRKAGERYLDTAYREIEEETSLKRKELLLISEPCKVTLCYKNKKWDNEFFVFVSKSRKIKLNIENASYLWIKADDIIKNKSYLEIFLDKEAIISILRKNIKI